MSRTTKLDPVQLRSMVAALILAPSASAAVVPAFAHQQPVTAVSATQAAPIEVTVSFKDGATAGVIIKTFWRDPVEARRMFDRLKVRWLSMANAGLDRVTYSDELVLHFLCDKACSAQRLEVTHTLTSALAALPEVAYAEAEVRVQVQAPRS